MSRHHIHFATGLPEDSGVISGMRRTCEVYIYIDGAKCSREGIVFYQSDNGVILTAGVNGEGTIPTDYFLYVQDCDGAYLLDNRQQNKEL